MNTPVLLFDFEGTLLDPKATLKAFLFLQWQSHLDELLHIPAKQYVHTVIEALEYSGDSPTMAFRKAYLRVMDELKLSPILASSLEQDHQRHRWEFPRLYPNCINLLRDLTQVARLGLLSNGSESEHIQALEKSGIREYFSEIFVTDAVSEQKPASTLFSKALVRFGVEPHDVTMIGDSLEEDVLPARSLGMHSLLFLPSNRPRPLQLHSSDCVSSLMDLPHDLRNFLQVPAG